MDTKRPDFQFYSKLFLPIVLWGVISGFSFLMQKQGFQTLSWYAWLVPVLNTLSIACLAWGAIGVSGLLFNQFSRSQKNPRKYQHRKTTVGFLKNISHLIIYVILALYALQAFGVDTSNLLAVGGIAGLAIGLASREVLANVFGGIMLFFDRPFREGDWVYSSDREVEGVIKKIGLRMTEIETFSKYPIYVPNSIFSNIVISNPSRMRNRRIKEMLSLRYKDYRRLKKTLADIEKYLKKNEKIDANQIVMVHLIKLSDFSLDFQIYCFTKSTNWGEYRATRQEVLLAILGIIHKNGADVPFPVRTIEFEDDSVDVSGKLMQKENDLVTENTSTRKV